MVNLQGRERLKVLRSALQKRNSSPMAFLGQEVKRTEIMNKNKKYSHSAFSQSLEKLCRLSLLSMTLFFNVQLLVLF